MCTKMCIIVNEKSFVNRMRMLSANVYLGSLFCSELSTALNHYGVLQFKSAIELELYKYIDCIRLR